MLETRTIPLHGDGELSIGGEPSIEGLIRGWVRKAEGRRDGSFMISLPNARELAELLRGRQLGRVKIFAGSLTVCHGGDLSILWFYSWGNPTPDFVARLYGGAADRLVDALEDHCSAAATSAASAA